MTPDRDDLRDRLDDLEDATAADEPIRVTVAYDTRIGGDGRDGATVIMGADQ
jgi:hypothetical protein